MPKHSIPCRTKIKILQAASQLFAKQGYHATSLQQIADAVGIKKQSLYAHYPSKEMLATSAIRYLSEQVINTLLPTWSERNETQCIQLIIASLNQHPELAAPIHLLNTDVNLIKTSAQDYVDNWFFLLEERAGTPWATRILALMVAYMVLQSVWDDQQLAHLIAMMFTE